jgi:hypothetical protein
VDVERRVCDVQRSEQRLEGTFWMAGCILGDVDQTRVFLDLLIMC